VSELDQYIHEEEKKASHVKAVSLLQQKPSESIPHSSVELSSFKMINTDACQQSTIADIHSAPQQSAVTPPAPLPPDLPQPPQSEPGTTSKAKAKPKPKPSKGPLMYIDLQAALKSRRIAMGCDEDEEEAKNSSQDDSDWSL
jgi:cell division septation protein DedD